MNPPSLLGFEIFLLHGSFPSLLKLVVAVAFSTSVGWRTSPWRRRCLPAVVVTTATLTSAMAVLLATAQIFPGPVPQSFYLWAALPLGATVVAVVGWTTATWWRRVIAIATVPLSLLLAVTLLNAYFGYYATLGAAVDDIAGRGVPGQLSVAELATLPAAIGRGLAGSGEPERGRIVAVDIPATASGFAHRRELVYLPPAWFSAPRSKLPVLEMVGAFGTPASWIWAGHATDTADRYAAAHHGWAPILVFVDHLGSFLNDTECVDGPKGDAEAHLTGDVRPYVVRTFGASADPASWGVVGFSMGGTCAIDLVLRHPDQFAVFDDIAGDLGPNLGDRVNTIHHLYGGSESAWAAHDPLTLLAHRRYSGISGMFVVGTADRRPQTAAWRLDRAAILAGIDARVAVRPGGHTWPFGARAFTDDLPWLVEALTSPHAR